ncbi:hypothetical protein CPB86DRAFT_46161 [Serendipita vermifera]|nr:hypothetical protein CPB86DRAFT_46161 [Serendipita vermifera]
MFPGLEGVCTSLLNYARPKGAIVTQVTAFETIMEFITPIWDLFPRYDSNPQEVAVQRDGARYRQTKHKAQSTCPLLRLSVQMSEIQETNELIPDEKATKYIATVWTERYRAASMTPPDFHKLQTGELPSLLLSIIENVHTASFPGSLLNSNLDLAATTRNTGPAASQSTAPGVDSDDSESSESNQSSFSGNHQFKIFYPMMTSTNYYWFGQSPRSLTWNLKQHEVLLPFLPFCGIQSFDVIWSSQLDEGGQRYYILKPIPKHHDYKALGYCFHKGTTPQPDLSTEPWNLLRAVRTSLLQPVSYKADLMWLDTSGTRPCSVWKVIPDKSVLPPDLFLMTSESQLPEFVWLIKRDAIKIPEWLPVSSMSRWFKAYDTYDSVSAFDSVKDTDRKVTSHLIKLLKTGNTTTQSFAAGWLVDIAKYPNLREDIRSSISQLNLLRTSEHPRLADAAKKALSQLSNYSEFSQEMMQHQNQPMSRPL